MAGIPVRLHVTVLAIAAALALRLGWLGIPSALLLFLSLLGHELAHALAARRYGITTDRIDLLVFGGMAVMDRPGATPREELVIAGAGPAASLAIGLAFLVPAVLLDASFVVAAPRDLFAVAAALNLSMGLFNLVPALPMDGGRIFRAALSPRLGHVRATAVAAWVSRAIGVVFVLWGLSRGRYGLVTIGGLLFWMVAREERAAPLVAAWRAQSSPGLDSSFDLASSGTSVGSTVGAGPETREEFIDGHGRRYVIVTKLR